MAQARALYERVCQGGAAAPRMMTETELTVEIDKACSDTLPNTALEMALYENLKLMGPVPFDEQDRAFAEQIRKSPDRGAHPLQHRTYGADVASRPATARRPAAVRRHALSRAGSTDVGDVSWITPTAQVYGATWAIGTPGHSWQVVAQGKSPGAHKAMLHAAQGARRNGPGRDPHAGPDRTGEGRAPRADRRQAVRLPDPRRRGAALAALGQADTLHRRGAAAVGRAAFSPYSWALRRKLSRSIQKHSGPPADDLRQAGVGWLGNLGPPPTPEAPFWIRSPATHSPRP